MSSPYHKGRSERRNILTNSSYDEGNVAGGDHPRWRTESASQFYAKSPNKGPGAGARTEQEIH